MNVLFVSLGCDKNLVDSEFMLGMLRDAGYSLTNDETEADAAVVNTCCFIHDAKEESIQTILELAEYKKKGRLKCLIVTGCLAERYRGDILTEIPEVDAVIGTTASDKIVDALEEALALKKENDVEKGYAIEDGHVLGDGYVLGDGHVPEKIPAGKKAEYYAPLTELPLPQTKRVNTTGGYVSYLKIAEGCDKHCTYCIIPSLRGSYRSVPMERLVSEARFLAEGGVKELVLVAQETTLYGMDLYGKKCLPELLKKLCGIPGIEWLRLLYCYPEEITDELIQTIKEEPKICHYLDIPVQHASDEVLKRMGRRTDRAELTALIAKLRREIPDIALRTSLITGFPGETEEDHQELLSFVRETGFERLGVFLYSKEENTPAAKMKPQVTKKEKLRRQKELMCLQQEISKKRGEEKIGRVLRVLVEGRLPEDDVYIGRSYMDAPNVDGYVFIKTKDSFLSGEFIDVKITQAKEYDLVGEAVSLLDEETERTELL